TAHSVAVELTGAGDRPGTRGRAGRAAADHRRAVEKPDRRLSGAAVVPKDVASTIPIEVACASNRPGARRRTRRATTDHRRAVDQPDHRLPGRRIVPDDVA